jgi:hypothetical protein
MDLPVTEDREGCLEDMMTMNGNRGLGLIALAWALSHPAGASGQMAPTPAGPSSPTVPPAALMMNPYLNPYLNPYINPLATQKPMSAGNAALFLYSAQAANGGMGAGRLSGTRPLPTTAQAQARPAQMPDSASVPGAGAARYFNPGPVNVNGAGRYYNRRNRYFQNNGR